VPAPLPGVLPAPVRRTLLYRRATGHLPPLLRPRTFTEKLNRRIMFDRRELLAPTCDKLAMKEHARTLAPGLVRVPETLWSGTDVGELAGVELPDHWVLKPNHSCIRRLFGRGPADVADLRRRTVGWVGERYWRKSEEWAYRRARPCLLVEEHVGVPGVVPADLKVLVVGGEPRLVELHTGRGDDHSARLYDPERGAVLLDGADLRELTFDSLADAVGVVSQETYLFHASVRENLRFARPDATDE